MRYPVAERADLVIEAHGRKLADPYRWLEDRDSAPARTWLAAQDRLARDQLDSLPGREFFTRQIQRQFDRGTVGMPDIHGEWTFHMRRDPGDQHFKLHAADSRGRSRVVVDPEAIDPTLHTTLDSYTASPDGNRIAYLISSGGDENSILHVVDTATGDPLQDPTDRCHALYTPIAWLPDGSAFYYVRSVLHDFRQDGAFEGSMWRLLHHVVGVDPADDIELLGPTHAKADAFFPKVSLSGRWLVVEVTDMMPGTPTDVLVADLKADAELRAVVDGRCAEVVSAWGPDERLYLRTAQDAPLFRLDVLDPAVEGGPQPLIAADPVGVFRSWAVLDDTVVLNVATDDISDLRVHDRLTGKHVDDVPLPGRGSVMGPVAPASGGDQLWFTYSDFLTPQQIFSWGRADAAPVLVLARKEEEVASDVRVERLEFPSYDGVMVPMIVAWAGNMPAPRPALVEVYGGFGFSMLRPEFNHWAAAWTAAGGIYAVVGARGGGEKGEAWHRAGMRENKRNTFYDFIAAGRWLVANGYTTHEQLAGSGLSNGALTTAASAQLSPETFVAIVSCAIHSDMLKGLRDPHEDWSHEYGDGRDPTEFEWLLSYSPYHNAVQGTCYPATLVCAFGHDTRTVPEEGHKYVALMQWAQGCDRPVVLRHEEEAGHSTRSVRQMVDLLVDWLSFCAFHTGLLLPG